MAASALLAWLAVGAAALHTAPVVLRRAPRVAMVAPSRDRIPLPRAEYKRTPHGPARNMEKRLTRQDAPHGGGHDQSTRGPVRGSVKGEMAAARASARAGRPDEAVSLARTALRAWATLPAPSSDKSTSTGGAAAQQQALALVRDVNQLLRELGDRGDMAAAQELFDCMIESGLEPTQVRFVFVPQLTIPRKRNASLRWQRRRTPLSPTVSPQVSYGTLIARASRYDYSCQPSPPTIRHLASLSSFPARFSLPPRRFPRFRPR
jgi:hypothetical protein